MKYYSLCFGLLLVFTSSTAQRIREEKLDELANQYAQSSFETLKTFLSIPNDAHFPDDIEQNVLWCEKAFQEKGFQTERLATSTVPLLVAHKPVKKAKKTVLIYLQVDGQPVDTARWAQESPYLPVLKKPDGNGGWIAVPWHNLSTYQDDWRVFARSASDAKGPIVMFLAALEAMEAQKIVPNFNIKVIMDFEEELGSPRLPKAVKTYADKLKADMLLIFDGPKHISNKPTLTFGARGIATVTLTTYGPVTAQHSGHFGNYAPNPAFRMAHLLASMKNENGIVAIPGFYDGVSIDESTATILKAVPDDEARIKDRLQIATTDQVGQYYQEAIQYPSLNIRGMQSGWIDEAARTIVPAWARAEIDIRLVKASNPERLISLLENHVTKQGYFITQNTPTKAERLKYPKIATFTSKISYQAFRTDFDSPVGLWLQKALTHAFGQSPVMIRMSGGSIPIAPFVNTLGIPAVTVPTVNRDNNQHSPNENLRLGNYRDGIKTMMAILSQKL